MKAWRFSTESFPPRERAGEWRAAMHRLGLPVGELSECEPPSATVTCLTSPLGMDFALIEADAQVISGRRTDQPAAIWLAVLLEGEATLESEGAEQHLNVGDIAYGPTGRSTTASSLSVIFGSAACADRSESRESSRACCGRPPRRCRE
jgi:hypothetical protein